MVSHMWKEQVPALPHELWGLPGSLSPLSPRRLSQPCGPNPSRVVVPVLGAGLARVALDVGFSPGWLVLEERGSADWGGSG